MKKAGVIGWPIDHSRSPLIHNYWLETLGLEGSYEPIAVQPERAQDFFSSFKSGVHVGANVTIPHKETIIPHLDHLSDAAKAIGAVNTIWLNGDQLHGTNTDWLGFLGNLDQKAPGWDKTRKSALVLGAGGAARAILYALRQRDFTTIWLANRTLARAIDLAEHFGSEISPIELPSTQDHVADADIIINTTSLGMGDNPPLDLTLKDAKPSTLVTDIVYAPLVTPLLAEAAAHNLKTVDGLGMLLHQAAPGFELWFNEKPEVSDELRALVEKDMGLS